MRQVQVRDISFGGNLPFVLIAGPCVIESEGATLEAAARLKEITTDLGIPFIFKSSYDKANRSSARSYRGPGLERRTAHPRPRGKRTQSAPAFGRAPF